MRWLALLLVACTPPVTPEPPTPGATCDQACSVLRRLDCPEGATTPKGNTCEAICDHVSAAGYMSLPVECVAGQTSIEGVRACGVRCQQ